MSDKMLVSERLDSDRLVYISQENFFQHFVCKVLVEIVRQLEVLNERQQQQ